jgi:hypothetical protein
MVMVEIFPCCKSMREMINEGIIFPMPGQDYSMRVIGNNDLPRVYNNITHCPSCGQRIAVNRDLLDEEINNARDKVL